MNIYQIFYKKYFVRKTITLTKSISSSNRDKIKNLIIRKKISDYWLVFTIILKIFLQKVNAKD